jgi:hypothetical protein
MVLNKSNAEWRAFGGCLREGQEDWKRKRHEMFWEAL